MISGLFCLVLYCSRVNIDGLRIVLISSFLITLTSDLGVLLYDFDVCLR